MALSLGQVMLGLAVSHFMLALAVWGLASHYISATEYRLERSEWVCSKAKKISSGDRPELWREGYYFPSEGAREAGCLQYSKPVKGKQSGQP